MTEYEKLKLKLLYCIAESLNDIKTNMDVKSFGQASGSRANNVLRAIARDLVNAKIIDK